jgi:SNF2 family DNA or RNA helicase
MVAGPGLSWVRHRTTGHIGQVLESRVVWGTRVLRLWLPAVDTVIRVAEDQVQSLEAADGLGVGWRLVAAAAAGRIAETMAREDTLLSPLEGRVTPLPHQLYALSRAMSGDRIRYLFADEVGLGKTIEAGLVLRELKLRGLVQRVLVVAPMGLCTQWVQEMQGRFQEDFTLVLPNRLAALRQLGGAAPEENLWRRFDQVISPVDGLKPLERRRGWSLEQLRRYNRERFEDVVTAGWDLIIIDEAHRLAGSTTDVARYKLGEALSQAAPYLLLLSATPHQGKTDAFRRLLSFLDRELFLDDSAITQARVAPLVVRTEKRLAIDCEGAPLFRPRRTELRAVAWGGREEQRALYEAVTDYVRDGYNQARRDRRSAIGFLMILFQRMVSSSTHAIRAALERRLEALSETGPTLELLAAEPTLEWRLDEEEETPPLEELLRIRRRGLHRERDEVEHLLSLARRCEVAGPDAKAEALLALIQSLEREEGDPELKVLVFTEFVPTQEMLTSFLGARGYAVACLNGSLDMGQRREVQRAFREEARVLLSTDAGGEGLNLQFAHVVVNYDLPWNPMKIEQRIGRVDRIGQTLPVRAYNLALEDSVELRVREVLEEKLARILAEFGVDKLSDVLDSDAADLDFDQLYVEAVLKPEEAEARAADFAATLREKAREAREGSRVLGESAKPQREASRRILEHQLPFWTERLTVAWLRANAERGGVAKRDAVGWSLRWPSGQELPRVSFERAEAEAADIPLLTIEDPLLAGPLHHLPHAVPGQPIPAVELPGISNKVVGIWSLWRVTLQAGEDTRARLLPLFVTDENQALLPAARAIWEQLIRADVDTLPFQAVSAAGEEPEALFERLRQHAEKQGGALFEALRGDWEARLSRERLRGEYTFSARRQVVERLGLASVRAHRLRQLEADQRSWSERLDASRTILPGLTPLVLVRIASEGTL